MGDNQQQDRGLFSGLYNKVTGVKTESTQWDGSYANPHQNQGNFNNQGNNNSAPPAYVNNINSHGTYNPSAGMAAPAVISSNQSGIVFGAVVGLKHNNSGRFLSSQGINYQSGSGQQQVTTNQWNITETEKWQIVSGFNQSQIQHGTPVNFNQVIRLRHVSTGRYLHSHPNIHSPISQHQEVSGYGNDQQSDENDNWIIEKFNYNSSNEGGICDISSAFKLKHCSTGAYLYSHEKTMQVSNVTHAEVACFGSGSDENNKWRFQLS